MSGLNHLKLQSHCTKRSAIPLYLPTYKLPWIDVDPSTFALTLKIVPQLQVDLLLAGRQRNQTILRLFSIIRCGCLVIVVSWTTLPVASMCMFLVTYRRLCFSNKQLVDRTCVLWLFLSYPCIPRCTYEYILTSPVLCLTEEWKCS